MKNFLSLSTFLILFYAMANTFFIAEILYADDTGPSLSEDHCLTCHREMGILPSGFNENDIHMQPGLSCSGCHGGNPASEDPEVAMSPKNGFAGVPTRAEIPQFCGKCHSSINFMRTYRPRIQTDQVEQYYTSVHGKKLQLKDQKVAECVSCHTSHAIFSVKDARSTVYPLNVPNTCKKCHSDPDYMKEYHIPTDQFEKYAASVHGMDLLENKDTGAPACNDCHGNHGATPPGIESVSHVCGNCHVNNLNYFTASPMAEPFEQLDVHACEQCHGNHGVQKTSDEMVGVGESSVCTACHDAGDNGYHAAEQIHHQIKTFVNLYDSAQVRLKDVQQKGMDDVDILFLLQEANQDLIHTRTLVHTFDPSKVAAKAGEGIKKTNEAIVLEKQEVKDYHTRRRGFGIATLFITVLAVALFFKIRDMEKLRKKG